MTCVCDGIPLDIKAVIEEIQYRQGLSWNNGRINDYNRFPKQHSTSDFVSGWTAPPGCFQETSSFLDSRDVI